MQIQPRKVKPGKPDVVQIYEMRKCLKHYPRNGQVFMQDLFKGGHNLGLRVKEGPGCQPRPDSRSSLSAGGVLVPKSKCKREISLT